MPRFFYKAKKGPAEIIQGEMDAESEDAALSKLTGLGLVPIRLVSTSAPAPVKSQKSAVPEPAVSIDSSRVQIPYRDLHVFTRQFAILLKASVPLLKIFEVLQSQNQNAKFRKILRDIQDSLRQGSSLSECLARYPRIFSQVFVSMVHSGEVSGTLEQVLQRLADFAEKDAEVRGRVQAAFVYPLFLLLVGIGTIFILLTFVMPKLMTLFADMGTELPTITKIIMAISRFCQAYWIFILGGAAFIVIWLRSRGLTPNQKKSVDRLMLKLPVLGTLVQKSETARFLRSLELLYENGVPLFRAVDIATKTVTSSVIRDELEKVPARLEGGSTLASSLEEIPAMSAFVTQMVSVGEESGQLGSAVRETAAFYESETNQVIKILTSLLEPFMILTIGIVVGFIVISMLLPIFDIQALAQ